ncbi:MAG: DNA polymerase I [Gammaproteobacteria bacterium]|nr:DNA polymerase I [Gammaproteobacteria bacterium]
MQNSPFILVDGSSYLYRAYHALPALTTSKGQPTGAVYGVISMLRRLVNDYHPQHMVVVFDAKGKTFRHDLYPQYKAHRPPMPDELIQQIKPLHEIIKAMRIPLLVIEGVEADDVIGTLAQKAVKKGAQVLISTGDKDLAQLVNANVTLVNTMTNTLLDRRGVEEKFGVKPEQIVDYLTLIGDPTDNIPGVLKAGPKTVSTWLKDYGSLDNLISHASEITGRVGENLRASLNQLPLSKELVTIRKNVDLDIDMEQLVDEPDDREKLIALFKELEFKNWLAELLEEHATHHNRNYEAILDEKTLENEIQRLENTGIFALDTETTSLDYIDAELVGLSFSTEAGKGVYIPLAHQYPEAPAQLNREWVLGKLKPLLENTKLKKIGHNLKYDKEVLLNHHINLQGVAFDTMLESYVFNSVASRHNLDALALKYLGYKTTTYEDVAGRGAKKVSFQKVPIEKAVPYACEDADISLRLHQYFWPKLEDEVALKKVLLDIEMPLLEVLCKMERKGVIVDDMLLKQQSTQIEKHLQELTQKAYQQAGIAFNMNSPKQLQEILYEKLGLPILKKTPGGQPSTAEAVLQDLALDFPLPKLILEYRSLSKLKSTYTDRLPEQISAKTGRVHTSYNQAIAATGRLSSSDPNLQNIPIRTPEGRKIRQAFIAPKGYKLAALDYSQIELRIMAHLSQDAGLIRAFSKGSDIHKATASEIFGVDINKVTPTQRRKAKAINFGLIYGMSAFGLAKQIQAEREAAQAYMDVYFSRYPSVKVYMERIRQQAKQQGYVETLFGRRLYTPDMKSQNMMRRKAAERAAINAPMQGTAADIIKKAMIAIDHWITEGKIDAHMIMQVHDELVFEVAEPTAEKTVAQIQKLMENIVELSVPLIVDGGIGNNWDEAH